MFEPCMCIIISPAHGESLGAHGESLGAHAHAHWSGAHAHVACVSGGCWRVGMQVLTHAIMTNQAFMVWDMTQSYEKWQVRQQDHIVHAHSANIDVLHA